MVDFSSLYSDLKTGVKGILGIGSDPVKPPVTPNSGSNPGSMPKVVNTNETRREVAASKREDPHGHDESVHLHTDSIMQFKNQFAGYTITDDVGPRPQPCAGASTNHLGMDVALTFGTRMKPFSEGWDGGFRKQNTSDGMLMAVFSHGLDSQGRPLEFVYRHLSGITRDKDGKPILITGSAGTGDHLHMEVRSKVPGGYIYHPITTVSMAGGKMNWTPDNQVAQGTLVVDTSRGYFKKDNGVIETFGNMDDIGTGVFASVRSYFRDRFSGMLSSFNNSMTYETCNEDEINIMKFNSFDEEMQAHIRNSKVESKGDNNLSPVADDNKSSSQPVPTFVAIRPKNSIEVARQARELRSAIMKGHYVNIDHEQTIWCTASNA